MTCGTLTVLGVGVVAISTAAPLIKLVPEIPPLVVAAYRMTGAALVFTPLSLVRLRREGVVLTTREVGIIATAGICLALHFASWIASLRYTSVASSVVLVTINPLLLAIAGYLIWGERLARRQWAGVGLALLGSICIGWNDFSQPGGGGDASLYGDALALGGAVMASAYLLCGRIGRSRLRVDVYVGLVYANAAAMLVVACVALRLPLSGYQAQDYAVLTLLALVPQVIGHTILNWALAHVSATLVAVTMLGEPIGSSALAWFFLNEPVFFLQGVGAACILTGIWLGRAQLHVGGTKT